MHTALKDLQISGMAARLMMWLHARSCVLPSFEWTSSNYHCSLPDSAYRQQQALLDHQTWLQLKDTRSDNFLHSRTKNAVILVLSGPKITPDQKFRDTSPMYGQCNPMQHLVILSCLRGLPAAAVGSPVLFLAPTLLLVQVLACYHS